MPTRIEELATLVQFMALLIDEGNQLSVAEVEEAASQGRLIAFLRERFHAQLSWIGAELAAYTDPRFRTLAGLAEPGKFGGSRIGLCLIIGWIAEIIKDGDNLAV